MTVTPFSVMRSDDPDPDEIGRLLLLSASGEEDAFRSLFDQTAGSVYGHVLRIVRDRSMSEEVTQEVFTQVWRTAARFDPNRGSGRAWIFTIAHRRAVDRIRSEQAGTARTAKYAASNHPTDHADVSEDVTIRLEHASVRKAMDQLTPVQRSAINLAFYKGYTNAEVAAALDIPLGTAKTRLRDGMIHLRDALGVQT